MSRFLPMETFGLVKDLKQIAQVEEDKERRALLRCEGREAKRNQKRRPDCFSEPPIDQEPRVRVSDLVYFTERIAKSSDHRHLKFENQDDRRHFNTEKHFGWSLTLEELGIEVTHEWYYQGGEGIETIDTLPEEVCKQLSGEMLPGKRLEFGSEQLTVTDLRFWEDGQLQPLKPSMVRGSDSFDFQRMKEVDEGSLKIDVLALTSRLLVYDLE